MSAKDYLINEITLAVEKNGRVYISGLRGIKPVLNFIDEGNILNGASVADRIIGKASAMLLVKAGIKELYAEVLSESGEAILKKYNIPYSYGSKVEYIVNRTNTGMCPMEMTVKDIDDLNEAEVALRNKVRELAAQAK